LKYFTQRHKEHEGEGKREEGKGIIVLWAERWANDTLFPLPSSLCEFPWLIDSFFMPMI
jgi:hypothetical protein